MNNVKRSLLVLLFFIAVSLRLAPGLHTIIFPYDQARDVLIIKKMVETRHPTLLGPVSDIPGVHHGAIYYWIITPLYALDHYDPSLVVLFFAICSSFGVFTTFFVMRHFFSQTAAWIAAMLYTFSFVVVSFSRWISNPVFVIPLMPLFAFTLHETLYKRKHAFWLGLLFGLFVQFELVLGYLMFIVGYALVRGNKKVQTVGKGTLGFIFGASPLILAELKFHFQGIVGLLSSFSHPTGHASTKLSAILLSIPRFYSTLAKDTLFGISMPIAGLLGIILLIWIVHQRKQISNAHRQSLFVIALIGTSSVLLFFTGKSLVNFFLVGIDFCFIAVGAYALSLLYKQGKHVFTVVLLLLMVGSQLHLYVLQTTQSRAYVQVQQGVLLSQRDEVVASIYAHVGSKPFTISVLGTPYGIRTAWSYYLWHYSQQHGTQLPKWYGFVADGYVGDEILPKVDIAAPLHVTVYEPFVDIDSYTLEAFTVYQNEKTVLVQEYEINHHRIQIRTPKEDKK